MNFLFASRCSPLTTADINESAANLKGSQFSLFIMTFIALKALRFISSFYSKALFYDATANILNATIRHGSGTVDRAISKRISKPLS